MPIVRIDMKRGKSPEYKKKLLQCIHSELVAALGIEDWDRFQRIVEINPEDFETAPWKSDDFMLITLTLFPGRTKEQKKAAIEGITTGLQELLNVNPGDVFIIIEEPPLENRGMGGQQKG